MSSVQEFPVQFSNIDECPRHFRDQLKRAVDLTENIYDIIYSPAISSGTASLPGSVFCVTDRQWLIAQERSRSWFAKKDQINHGVIVTYFPRSRFSGFQIQKTNRFHILELEARGAHGSHSFQVRFPPDYEQKVVGLISKAASTFSKAPQEGNV
jgi:hypothetical protein